MKHTKRNIILGILLVIVLVGVYKIVYFELFKLCGNCGNPVNRNAAVTTTIQLDDTDNGKTFTLVNGWKATVTLEGNTWTFQPVADTSIVQQLGDAVTKPSSLNATAPGSEAETVTAEFLAVAPGTTAITATRTTCGNALACPPDQQHYTVTIIVATSLTQNDYQGYTLVYTSSNGSLPPPYHQEKVLTIAEDATGAIHATYEIKDYTKVLETRDLTVTSDQFRSLMNAGVAVGPNQPDALAGCTGGSFQSLTISQNGKTVLGTGAYACADQTSNASFAAFANTVGELFPDL